MKRVIITFAVNKGICTLLNTQPYSFRKKKPLLKSNNYGQF